MPETDAAPAPALDDETAAALTLYNEYVQADRERTQREKRVKKAERAKDEAAAAVKKHGDRGLQSDALHAHSAAQQGVQSHADRDRCEPGQRGVEQQPAVRQ